MIDGVAKAVGFVHLRVHSAYSLLEGALPIKRLVKLAAADRQPALGIADTGNLFGALEFSEIMAEAGIQPMDPAAAAAAMAAAANDPAAAAAMAAGQLATQGATVEGWAAALLVGAFLIYLAGILMGLIVRAGKGTKMASMVG